MKEKIHPAYYQTTIRCACGNEIPTGSTRKGHPGRNLFPMPSLFHRETKNHGFGRKDRAIPEEIRKALNKKAAPAEETQV